MTHPSQTSAERIGRISAMCRRGMSGRQIARELNLNAGTVARIISSKMLAIPKVKQPAKEKTTSINRKATADYSRAKITRIPLPPQHASIVCNAMMRERYVPTELHYRGRQ